MTQTGSIAPIAFALAGCLISSGCSEAPRLVVATGWDRSSCRALADALRADGSHAIPRIRWVRLDPWDDPGRLLETGRSVDLVLGFSASTLSGLDRRGLLAPADDAALFWEPSAIFGGVPPPEVPDSRRTRFWAASFPIGDPRIDPVARDEAADRLSRADGYATLIEDAARASSIAVEGSTTEPTGAALVAGGSHPGARPLLDAIRRLVEGGSVPASPIRPIDPGVRRLSAELVGATAIDAGAELRRAWSIIERSPDAEIGMHALVEPPQWPPSSVLRLRDDPARRPLLDTLAGALVDDPEARAWLLDSWAKPSRPVDRDLIAELAGASGGRLIASPRVLPWLRAEWAASSRRRYEQVARELKPIEPIEVPR